MYTILSLCLMGRKFGRLKIFCFKNLALNHLNHSLVRNILLFQLTELGLSHYYDKKPEKIATELKQC